MFVWDFLEKEGGEGYSYIFNSVLFFMTLVLFFKLYY